MDFHPLRSRSVLFAVGSGSFSFESPGWAFGYAHAAGEKECFFFFFSDRTISERHCFQGIQSLEWPHLNGWTLCPGSWEKGQIDHQTSRGANAEQKLVTAKLISKQVSE